MPFDNVEEIIEKPEFKADLLAGLDAKAREFKLNSLEKLKKLHLTTQPFTVENGTMTPTMKLKRNQAKEMYASVIEGLYSETE